MPTAARTARTDAGLASELRLSVMRRRRRDAWLARRLREPTPEEREVLRRAAPLLEGLSTA